MRDVLPGKGAWAHSMWKYARTTKVSGLFAVVVAGVVVLITIGVSSAIPSVQLGTRRAIVDAARAPFLALARKDSGSLCSVFTHATANYLGSQYPTPTHANCVERVDKVFAEAEPVDRNRLLTLAHALIITRVRVRGTHASARVGTGRGSGSVVTFVRGHRGWLIATRPWLVLARGCHDRVGATNCPNSSRIIVFGFRAASSAGGLPIDPPSTIRLAGGKKLREFMVGARVAVGLGCLACHRIGDQGNAYPGSPLTHVGSFLTEGQIVHALVSSSEPMPSFRNLPKSKMVELVRFLTLLK